MTTIDDVRAFVAEHDGLPLSSVRADTDLFGDGGLYGDDCGDLLRDFAHQYSVDMNGYLWYFHSSEEAFLNPGGLLFKPPNARVTRIPVTPALLLEAATTGRWPVSYPPHSIPSRRYDMWVNYLLFGALAGAIILA